MPTHTVLLTTKQHFKILDGLRGVAAVAVVIFHFMEFAVPDYTNNILAHSYLAVDFFFCLSGFVIAYAYDNKLASMGVSEFIKLRLIRLHPFVIIGSILGLVTFLFDPYSNLYAVYGCLKTFLMFMASCLLIPFPVVHERYFNIFHLNPPTWSLFWEYIANVFYALILCKVRNSLLVIFTLVAAFVLCYESYSTGNLAVGWGGENFFGGGIRIFYSFLAGMVVYRSGWIIKSQAGFMTMSVLLAGVFFIPYADATNWIIDPIVVLFYFPFLVALGAGAKLTPSYSNSCKFLGDISYPLYMIHYPFLWLFLSYVEKKKPTSTEMGIIITLGLISLIVFAYLVMRFLEEPIRKYLIHGIVKARQKRSSTTPALLTD